MTRGSVLVVDDRANVVELIETVLEDAYDVTTTVDARAAMSLLEEREFDVVLSDVRMAGATGFDVLAAVRRHHCDTSVVLMTGYATVPDAVSAIRQGAFDYLAKPFDAPELQLVLARAMEDHARRVAGQAPAHGAIDTHFREAVEFARDRASRDYLVALMHEYRGNVTRAATRASLTRQSLHRLLKRYGVHSDEYKRPPATGRRVD